MSINKDFKRLVRARMSKTGESYTSARANLLRRPAPSRSVPARRTAPAPAAASPPATIDYAARAGMSDAAVEKRTGCTWEKWVFALDHAGADTWSHRAIAAHVRTTYKVSNWSAQMVTVGYERIKGLREKGQRRDGWYEASKSRTLAATAADAYRAFADGRVRRRWLPSVKVTVRKGTPGRFVRMTWDDNTPVEVWLTPKGAAKTSVQVQHRKLTSKDEVDRRRRYWDDRLAALGTLLTGR
jgi:hypothetical protein